MSNGIVPILDIAWQHLNRGEYASAISVCNAALAEEETHAALGNKPKLLGLLASVYRAKGDFKPAFEYSYQALALLEEHGKRGASATLIGNLGNLYSDIGDHPVALEHYLRALAIHEEFNEVNHIIRTLNNIAIAYRITGNYPEALEKFHQALAMLEEHKDSSQTALITGNLGNLLRNTGDFHASLEHHKRAQAMHEELGLRGDVARDMANVGLDLEDLGDYFRAIDCYRQACDIYESIGAPHMFASVSTRLIGALIAIDELQEARERLSQITSKPHPEPIFTTQIEICRSRLLEKDNDLTGAKESLERALVVAKQQESKESQVNIHKMMRELARKSGDFDGYVIHNDAMMLISEKLLGSDQMRKISALETRRKVESQHKETEKQIAVLHSALPKHIADRVARGEVVNDQIDSASVIFLDIVGFTEISSRIPAGHVVHLLESIFETCDHVCAKHDVTKIKTIGDSYMAVAFPNSEQQQMSNQIRAAYAALEMLTALEELNVRMPPELGDTSWVSSVGDIQVRIGIHSGPVVAGIIGKERMQYDVWGDTVNVASRLEGSSEPGRIHVSDILANALNVSLASPLPYAPSPTPYAPSPTPYALIPRGEIAIKGKGALQTFWLEISR